MFNEKCLIKPLITISFILFFLIFYYYIYDGTTSQLSKINGKEYFVKDDSNKQIKAELLADLHSKLDTIISSLKKESQNSENVRRLINNWDKGITIKETGNMEADAAYVINKQYMSICLKDFVKTINLENSEIMTKLQIT